MPIVALGFMGPSTLNSYAGPDMAARLLTLLRERSYTPPCLGRVSETAFAD